MIAILGIIVLILVGCFYAYVYIFASIWVTNKPDERPFFMTTKPIIVKNILLPTGSKIIYEKRYFWEKYEQKELGREKDIITISFKEEIDWGGVPIMSITKFFNSAMKGFSLYADFDEFDTTKETQFYKLWKSCGNDLSISVKETNDWSFNKGNISDVQGCGVNYQRFFKEDAAQQGFLDSLLKALIEVKD